jgi:hypothetical protein
MGLEEEVAGSRGGRAGRDRRVDAGARPDAYASTPAPTPLRPYAYAYAPASTRSTAGRLLTDRRAAQWLRCPSAAKWEGRSVSA